MKSRCVTWLIHICDINHFTDLARSRADEIAWLFSKLARAARSYCSLDSWWFFTSCHSHAWNHLLMLVTWLIQVCDMTHGYMRHDSFICDTCHVTHVWHDSLMCDMTHSCVTWLTHVWHDSLICDMTHSYMIWLTHMWHDSFTCMTMTCLIHGWQGHTARCSKAGKLQKNACETKFW